MLYLHSLPPAEASSFLAILHHFKKVLKFQLLQRETRDKEKKKYCTTFLLSFLEISFFFIFWGGGNSKHFPNFFYYFFSSFLNPWFCLPWMYDCVLGCCKYNTPPPLFSSLFPLFFRNQNQNWYLVSVRLALRHAPSLEEELSSNISSFVATLAARSGVSLVAQGWVVYLLLLH